MSHVSKEADLAQLQGGPLRIIIKLDTYLLFLGPNNPSHFHFELENMHLHKNYTLTSVVMLHGFKLLTLINFRAISEAQLQMGTQRHAWSLSFVTRRV